MAKKAIYGKYECVESTYIEYVKNISATRFDIAVAEANGTPVYKNYSFDKNTGLYTGENYVSVWNNTMALNTNPCYVILRAQNGKMMYEYDNQYQGGGSRCADRTTYTAKSETRYNYNKGSYITDIITDYNSLPANGRHSDGYWYVYIKMASDLKGNDTGIWRDIPTGWANDSGVWKPQSELKANVNGIFK